MPTKHEEKFLALVRETDGRLHHICRARGLAGWPYTIGYTVFAAVLGWGIIVLNRRAVQRTLQPKRKEILALLAQIES